MFYVTEGGGQSCSCRLKVLMSPSGYIFVHTLYHSHPVFYSFIQPRSPSEALVLVLFKEQNKSTHFLPVRDENVCLVSLLCTESSTLVKLGYRKPLRAPHLCEILRLDKHL